MTLIIIDYKYATGFNIEVFDFITSVVCIVGKQVVFDKYFDNENIYDSKIFEPRLK